MKTESQKLCDALESIELALIKLTSEIYKIRELIQKESEK